MTKKKQKSLKGVEVALECPDHHDIMGTVEIVPGTAYIRGAVDFGPGKKLELDYAGETEMYWDGQESIYEDGERLFVCTEGHEWKESQLVKIRRAIKPRNRKS